MMGDEHPSNLFDAAKVLFINHYELFIHQRLTRALALCGIVAEEKPSQCMAQFRNGQLGSRRCRMLGSPLLPTTIIAYNPQTTYTLTWTSSCTKQTRYVSLPPATISAIVEVQDELAAAVHANDLPVVSALFEKHGGKGGIGRSGSGDIKQKLKDTSSGR